VRSELGIKQGSKVILYVGRLNLDKGILDLAAAFNSIARKHAAVDLLLVGAEEEVCFRHIQERYPEVSDRLHYISFTSQPERYMAAADIFCLPSYREGFGLTIIEAAACALPAIASRIYGITDAVEDGVTGILFPAADITALTQSLLKLIEENDTLKKMGKAACVRALELFSSEKNSHEMLMLYEQLVLDSIGK
jgi:glycosyltransferase involved in cell wall biosynthesis